MANNVPDTNKAQDRILKHMEGAMEAAKTIRDQPKFPRLENNTLIVTRHGGAYNWLTKHGIDGVLTQHVSEEDVLCLPPGTVVVGVLPVSLAVLAAQQGARVFLINLSLTPEQRGKELTAEEMEGCVSLNELTMEWRTFGNPQSDGEYTADCRMARSGIPNGADGDMQQFRIGFPRRHPSYVAALSAG